MKFYRYFLDNIEESTTGIATKIIVNSEFTRQVFLKEFPTISKRDAKDSQPINIISNFMGVKKHLPEILYPTISEKAFLKSNLYKNLSIKTLLESDNSEKKQINYRSNTKIFTSLNRYERKKNIGLSIRAFKIFKQELEKNKIKDDSQYVLVIAGGYDLRVTENVEHHKELITLTE